MQNFGKKCNFKVLTKIKILEYIICNLSTNFFGGKEIAQEKGEILLKV